MWQGSHHHFALGAATPNNQNPSRIASKSTPTCLENFQMHGTDRQLIRYGGATRKWT